MRSRFPLTLLANATIVSGRCSRLVDVRAPAADIVDGSRSTLLLGCNLCLPLVVAFGPGI